MEVLLYLERNRKISNYKNINRNNMITEEQKRYLLPIAFNAAVRAGKVILDIYDNPSEMDIDIKSDNTPITKADKCSHELLKQYLGQTRIPILSEEGREMLYDERKSWDLFWMVDPLDGTKEFIKGNGEFTVNVALMVDNKPCFGVVYVPFLHKIYFNDPYKGGFVRENVVPDSNVELCYDAIFESAVLLPLHKKRNNPVRVALSRSHNTPETYRHVEHLKAFYPDAEVVEQGSSYKLCLIAEGTFDYYVRTTHTSEWDTAAGEAIMAAAGAKILTYPDKAPLAYNKESLSNPFFTCCSRWFDF